MRSSEIESSHLFGLIAAGLGAFVLIVVVIALMWNATY